MTDRVPVEDNQKARERRAQDKGYTCCAICGGPIELFIDMHREYDGALYWAHMGSMPEHPAIPSELAVRDLNAGVNNKEKDA